MPFTNLGDEYASHPDFKDAGAAGQALDIAARIHCNRYRTGGFVDDSFLPTLSPYVKRPAVTARQLVSGGVWAREGEGHRIVLGAGWLNDTERNANRSATNRANAKRRWDASRTPNRSTSPPVPTDVSQFSQTTELGTPRSVENGKGDLLRKRMIDACVGTNRRLVEKESTLVLGMLREHVSDVVIDETIGTAMTMDKPPTLPRYFLAAVPDIAAKRGLSVPELRLPA